MLNRSEREESLLTNFLSQICGGFSIASMALLAYFLRQPDAGAAIVTSCVALGVFALGVYPLALELVVECTYPLDQVSRENFFSQQLIII